MMRGVTAAAGNFGLCVLLALVGCGEAPAGKKPDGELAQTTGVVTYKGNPVKGAQVTFYPQGQGNPGRGETAENGRFVLTTYKDKDGAHVGIHVVTVALYPTGALPGYEVKSSGVSPIPKKYEQPNTSTLTAEVKPGANNVELKLED
jgi:hypothetical protein